MMSRSSELAAWLAFRQTETEQAMLLKILHWLDRCAMSAGTRSSVWGSPSALGAAKTPALKLDGLDCLRQPMVVPELRFHRDHRFAFESRVTTVWPENNLAQGRLYPARPQWRSRPVVILLHGLNAELGHAMKFPLLARRWTRQGVNVVSLLLPYHGQRRPSQRGAVRNFITSDVPSLWQAVEQSLLDVRGLTAWLRGQGVPDVGLCGTSLGAWLSGLLICHDPNYACAALITPIVSMDRAVRELPFFQVVRDHWPAIPMDLGSYNLDSHVPLVDRDRVLIVAGAHDLLAPIETVEALVARWQVPEYWRIEHGHISASIWPPVQRRIVDWVSQRLLPRGGE